MKTRLFTAIPVLFLLMSVLLTTGCHQEKRAGEVPLVALKTYSGETYTVSPKDTLVTLVVFWATWCGPCKMEMPILMALQDMYGKRGFRVVGINIDDPDGSKARPIMEYYHINYPMLIGGQETISKFGGLTGIPTSFLVGRDGMLKKRTEGVALGDQLEQEILAQL